MSAFRTSRLAGVVLAGAIAIVTTVGLQLPAAAHNFIVSSTPAENETLTTLPEQWQITTNDDLLLLNGVDAGFAIIVSDSQGAYYGDGCLDVQGASLSMPAALGTDGPYTLTYQFISADGHTLSGVLPFQWQAPDGFEPHIGIAEPPVCGQTTSAPAAAEAEQELPDPQPAVAISSEVEPIEPISSIEPTIVVVVAFAVVVAVIGVVTGAILRSRARRPGESPDGDDLRR